MSRDRVPCGVMTTARFFGSVLVLLLAATACASDDGTAPGETSTSAATSSTTVPSRPTTSGIGARPPLTIMPIGDSITQGSEGWHTYRCHLDDLLAEADVAFDLVGSLTEPDGGDGYGCPWAFDEDHEGRWGWRVDEVLSEVPESAVALQPDVALIHLGTNDILQRQGAPETAEELRSLIERLRRARPDMAILIAQIIPCEPSTGSRCTVELPALNALIATMAADLATTQSPVVSVDMESGFLIEDLRDGVHPSDAGDRVIAERWFEALQELGLV